MELKQTVNETGATTEVTLHEGDTLTVRLVGKPAGAAGRVGLDSVDETLILRVIGGRAFLTDLPSDGGGHVRERVYEVMRYEVQTSAASVRDGVIAAARRGADK